MKGYNMNLRYNSKPIVRYFI